LQCFMLAVKIVASSTLSYTSWVSWWRRRYSKGATLSKNKEVKATSGKLAPSSSLLKQKARTRQSLCSFWRKGREAAADFETCSCT
jgi:hypothetical protein